MHLSGYREGSDRGCRGTCLQMCSCVHSQASSGARSIFADRLKRRHSRLAERNVLSMGCASVRVRTHASHSDMFSCLLLAASAGSTYMNSHKVQSVLLVTILVVMDQESSSKLPSMVKTAVFWISRQGVEM